MQDNILYSSFWSYVILIHAHVYFKIKMMYIMLAVWLIHKTLLTQKFHRFLFTRKFFNVPYY